MDFEKDYPLSNLTSIGIGGKAEYFVRVRRVEELIEAVRFAKKEGIPLYLLGGGSNTIFGDVRGLVIKVEEFYPPRVEDMGDFIRVRASAGTPLKEIISLAVKENLKGIYRLMGFPATVGGAVAMNAGAFGAEIGDFLERVRFVRWDGEIEEVEGNELELGYRTSPFPHAGIITEITLSLRRSSAPISEEFRIIRERRRSTQPINRKTSGSTFKNPDGEKAGRLLEISGMKGKRVGNVSFSEVHANFLINHGGATFGEVLELIETAKERVKQETGYRLEEEVRLVEDCGSDGWKVL